MAVERFVFERDIYEKLVPASIRDRDKGDLKDFLRLFGIELDKIREDIDDLTTLIDLDEIDPRFLKDLGRIVGLDEWDFGWGLPEEDQREQIRWAVRLWKAKGTEAGILFLCRFVLFGLPTEIRAWHRNIARTYHPHFKDKAPTTWHPDMVVGRTGPKDTAYYTYGGRYRENGLGIWFQPNSESGIQTAFLRSQKLQAILSRYLSAPTNATVIFEGPVESFFFRRIRDVEVAFETLFEGDFETFKRPTDQDIGFELGWFDGETMPYRHDDLAEDFIEFSVADPSLTFSRMGDQDRGFVAHNFEEDEIDRPQDAEVRSEAAFWDHETYPLRFLQDLGSNGIMPLNDGGDPWYAIGVMNFYGPALLDDDDLIDDEHIVDDEAFLYQGEPVRTYYQLLYGITFHEGLEATETRIV